MSTTTKSAKVLLRKDIAARIKQLTADQIQKQSRDVQEQLFKNPKYVSANRVSVYLSLPSEIDTMPIVRDLLSRGKQCFIPRYREGGTEMDMILLKSMEEWAELPETKWKIKQHHDNTQNENALLSGGVDLILAPCCAVSPSGDRCGKGGGYYDRFIKQCKEMRKSKPYIIALALREQVVEQIPSTEFDQKVDESLYDCTTG